MGTAIKHPVPDLVNSHL